MVGHRPIITLGNIFIWEKIDLEMDSIQLSIWKACSLGFNSRHERIAWNLIRDSMFLLWYVFAHILGVESL